MQTLLKNIKKIIYYALVLFLVIGLLIVYIMLYNNSTEDYESSECKAELGCINDTLRQAFNASCVNGKCKQKKPITLDEIAKLADVEYDQAIYARRFQYDFSKSCGELNVNWKQRNLFSEECDYLVFSKGKEMTGYARGNCFSSSYVLEHLENNFWFSEKDGKSLLNQRVYNQVFSVGNGGRMGQGLSINFTKDN